MQRLLIVGLLAVCVASCAGVTANESVAAERAFVNLASKATITASSEHTEQKLFAPNVADGRFAHKGCQGFEFHPPDKPAKSWAVNGKEAKDKATLTFEWTTPVTASQIIYYPRMAFQEAECWKDYEVTINGGAEPVAKGSFPKVYAGHRIRFPKARVRKLTMKFLNSHGGWNPGATEIFITDRELPDEELAAIAPLSPPRIQPWDELSKQNVVWKSPSKDASGAMPIGNGTVLANVWVERNGDLLLGIGRLDAKGEKVTKLGRVRVKLDPALPTRKTFRQTLMFGNGGVDVTAGKKGESVTFSVWVDANRPVVNVQVRSKKAVNMTAALKPSGDSALTTKDNRVLCRRGNVTAAMLADGTVSPVDYSSAPVQATLKSEKPAAAFDLQVHVVKAEGEDWAEQANNAVNANRNVKMDQAIQAHLKAWGEFWKHRSVFVAGSDDANTITKALVRKQWLGAISGRGPYLLRAKPTGKLKEYKGPSGAASNPVRVALRRAKVEAGKTMRSFVRGGRFEGSWGPDFANLPKNAAADPLADVLRDMIVQAQGGKIYLFPGWPEDVDVSFRLALSGNRRIEAVYKDGKFDEIEVWPKRQTGNVVGVGPFAKSVRRALPGRFRMPALISFLGPGWVMGRVGAESMAVTMKKANFNGYEGSMGDLEWAKKHGFYLLYHGVNDWVAYELKDEKQIISYYQSDRRKTNWFPIFGNIRSHYESIDPNHPSEFTMYVRYGGFEYFVDAVRPRLLEYYDYHWTRGHHLQAAYLESFRARSIEAGGIPIFRYCHVHGDPPTKMRQTVTMSLAYGVKGFKWWVGWTMFKIHETKENVPPLLSPIGTEVGNINTTLKAFSPYITTAQSLAVYNTNPLPGGTRHAPKDYWVQPSGDHVVMGVFRNDDYDDHIYLVVGNRDIGSERTATLTFQEKAVSVSRIDKKTQKWIALPVEAADKGAAVKVKLEHGGCELIRVVRAKKKSE